MIIETGTVVSVEPEGLWVETISKTVCGSCKAEKGCGQSLMAKWAGHNSYIWVLLEGRDPAIYHQGDSIRIGIPEEVVAKGSMVIYILPLLVMVGFTFLADSLLGNELITVFSAIAGLVIGGGLVRWHAYKNRLNPNLQPVLVDDRQPVYLIQSE
jgi:sigma-E factor negative regulatory protein RseC